MPHVPVGSVLLVLVAATAGSARLKAQWTGEWTMDMTAGSVAFDLTPNANDGALMSFTGPNPWVPGMFGNALSFDGVDDYVMTANQTASIYDGLGSPYSVCYWVKAPAQNNAFVYAEGTIGTSAIFIFGSGQFLADQDKFRTYLRNDQGDVPLVGVSDTVVYDDTWHHVAFVDVAGDVSLYIDGVLDTATIAYDPLRLPGMPGHGTFSMNTASIGALRRGSVCCNMVGLVDDLRLYDFAMTQTDVMLAMASVPLITESASVGEYGVGCGAGPFDAVGVGSASLGGPGLRVDMQSGPPNALAFQLCSFRPIQPVDLGQFGFAGCTGYPQTPTSFVVGFLDAAGSGSGPLIAIPNNPLLSFVPLNCQAAVLAGSTIEFSDVVLAVMGR